MAETWRRDRGPLPQEDDTPTAQWSENLMKSKIPYVKSSGKAGFGWLDTKKHKKFFSRYKEPILFAIFCLAALLLLMVTINYLTRKFDDDSSESDLEKLVGTIRKIDYNIFRSSDEVKDDGADEVVSQVIYDDFEEPDQSLRRVHRIRKREAPKILGSKSDDGFLPRTTKLRRVQTGSKLPLETETDSYSDGSSNLSKRSIKDREKIRVCKRSVEQCKSVLNSMQSLTKAAGENVNSLNALMSQIQINEAVKKSEPGTFETFLRCIECNRMVDDDSITFTETSKEDEDANYNHPVYRNKQSEIKNVLTIAEMLNNPTSVSTEVKKRMIGQMQSIDDMDEFPSSWADSNIHDPNIQRTVDIATSQNKTDDMEVTYIIKNTTIIKHLSKGESREELSQPESIPIAMPTAPSLIFNTPGPEENWGWGEITEAQTEVQESPSATTAPEKITNAPEWNQEPPPRNIQSGARIAAGVRRQPPKSIYDGSSVMFPTAETTKTSQHVQFTPPLPWSPYPVCFFGSPNSANPPGPLGRQPVSFPASSPASFPFSTNQFAQRGFSYASPSMAQGFGSMQYQPQFPYGNPAAPFQQVPHLGPTAPGGQGFFPNFGNVPIVPGPSSQAPYYCTYMPTPALYQVPSQPGVAEFQRDQDYPSAIVTGREKSLNAERNPGEPNNSGFEASCTTNEIRCKDGSRCVAKELWCNIHVDCPDASDETSCSCRSRVNKDRICDGYFDCPRGEDELSCFGCQINFFSCKDWSKGEGVDDKCVPLSQRCDGLKQCPNGRDEDDCSILTPSFVENQNIHMIGYKIGYLHRNWRGQWYPACSPTEMWAVDACVAETGFPLRYRPHIRSESISAGEYSGPYVSLSRDGEIKVIPRCHETAVYVECPQIPCGTRVLSHRELKSSFGRNEDSFVGMAINATSNATGNVIDQIINRIIESSNYAQTTEAAENNASEIVGSAWRVVGGKASQPKAWPFLVAIHKDGFFRCGGIIINEDWILTAAHCVDGFNVHYYEIQAGVLRRLSFSGTAQTRRADWVKMHPHYDRISMTNDLALIKLDQPLLFNRWVRPACLPKLWLSEHFSSKEPLFDETCVTAGWGAVFEHGPDPDHLREVELPITRQCKHPEDRNDGEICAGLPQGGSDACQGDSGGPLMCNSPDSDNQWYVAGIVSHGEGCARPNEPGAYTKVSRFVDWIDAVIDNRAAVMSGPKPLAVCPGFICDGGLGKCLPAQNRCNGVADCLDAEDEINCPSSLFKMRGLSSPINTNSGNSEIVGQANPAFTDEIIFHTKPPNFLDDRIANPPIATESSTIDNQNTSTITSMVANASEATTESSTTQRPTTTTMNVSQFPLPYVKQPPFTCTRILQNINVDKRCDRIIDCEDGTDEDDCTCKDFLANLHPKAICNGHVDCDDGSDEENCGFCRSNEFACTRSGTCIPLEKYCDRKVDCENMDDELDCFALTNGDSIKMDFDGRPHLNLEGVVTIWKNQTWRPFCIPHEGSDLPGLSNYFCDFLGFGPTEFIRKVITRDTAMTIEKSTKNSVYPYEYPPAFNEPENTAHTCEGIYIACKPIVTANAIRHVITNPLDHNRDHLWPWKMSVFVDGRYQCPGTLLDRSWLLVASQCIKNLDLARNYTMAVAGTELTYLYVNGPNQQISSIDAIKPIKMLEAALLHLATPVNHTRHVRPVFLGKRIVPPTDKDECVAIGVDKQHRTNSSFIQPVTDPCPPCFRCYKNETLKNCNNETLPEWSGTIVCYGSGSWYPAATFQKIAVVCGFQSTRIVPSIDHGYAYVTQTMEGNFEPIAAPNCTGFRCPFGKCLPWDKVCDGAYDCRDGSDEEAGYCQKKKDECETIDGSHCKCSKFELTCANGQCVPREAFCNSHVDCADGSDETPHCTCADYLRLTAPDRLCNNVRDCLDKSDESSEMCECEGDRFKCSGGVNATETCVSRDFVCDGEVDCPNGEDEKFCRGIQGSPTDPRGTGQVLHRSLGIWHSECFPLPIRSTKHISDVCRSMNYNSGEVLQLENPDDVYGKPMVPEYDHFYMLRMNPQTWITLRKNRPLVTLVVANKPCYRLFVKCT